MMSENRVDGQMSGHFGKAEWVMAADTNSGTLVFLQNEAAQGKSIAELVASQNCTDAIFSEIGNGALGHLKAANIRGWMAPRHISGKQALEMFQHQQLQPATAADGHAGNGCCCANKTGSQTASCCHS
jgi:predicted Fe-Mo cluster-binding NifX family protein